MKDMLLSLQSSLMTNLSSLIDKFSLEMKHMDNRMLFTENKMEECTETVNDLIDAYTEQKDDSLWIKAKLADLEDLSRRIIKIRGIPESIPPKKSCTIMLVPYSLACCQLSPIDHRSHS